MKLDKLLDGIPHEIIQKGDCQEVSAITIDSREVKPGTLFICLRGLTVDGHTFINSAAEAGATAVLVEDVCDNYPAHLTVIRVSNTRRAMAYIAANFYDNPAKKLRLIGVTGTNGKTTTTYFIEEILRKLGRKTGLIGTVGARVGEVPLDIPFATSTTPDPLELHAIFAKMVEMGVQYVVMEVSSHALALYKMEGLTFDVGVFTNLTQDHLDFHGTMENYALAKAQLFAQSKVAVVNGDDEYTPTMLRLFKGEPPIKYSIHSNTNLQATNVECLAHGSNFELLGERFHLPISAKYNVYNILATIGTAMALNLGARFTKTATEDGVTKEIRQAVSEISGVPGRIQSVPNDIGAQIFVDYAHTPDSLEKTISSVREITGGRVITLFGCGGDRDTTKRPIMGRIAGRLSDYCILTSDNPRTEDPFDIIAQTEAGVKETAAPYHVCENRKDAIFAGVKMLKPGDALIIAGKGHEDYQEIGKTKYPFSDYETAVEALKLQTIESDHFIVNYYEEDASVVDKITQILESNYKRVTSILQVELPEKCELYIYPNITDFHKAIGRPGSPDWVAGNCDNGIIRIVSPNNPGTAHGYDSIMSIAVHEVVHLAAEQVNNHENVPHYMTEGLATYLAGQGMNVKEMIRKDLTNGNFPTMEQLKSMAEKIYQYGYAFMEYVVWKYGTDGMLKLYKAADIAKAFDISEDEFYQNWKAYMVKICSSLTIQEIAKACNGQVLHNVDTPPITSVSTHTKNIAPGALFVPTVGDFFDGHDFINAAAENGAVCALTEKADILSDIPLILVKSTRRALMNLGAYYRRLHNVTVVAITGSAGKTTTKDMIYHVLARKYKTKKTLGNFNNDMGVPLSIFQLEAGDDVLVLEMGMNHAMEIHELSKIGAPDIAVITHIGDAHIENFENREGILHAKLEIVDGLKPGGTVILNGDDPLLTGPIAAAKVLPFTVQFPSSKNIISAETIGLQETACHFNWRGQDIKLKVPLPGMHNAMNALLAAAVGVEMGVPPEDIAKGFDDFVPPSGRLTVKNINGMTVIDDAYNANPAAMRESIKILCKQPGRRVAILGDMNELGHVSEARHTEIGAYAAEMGIDLLIVIGPQAWFLYKAFADNNKKLYFPIVDEFLPKCKGLLQPGDVVLVKASRGMAFERIIDELNTH